MKKYLIATAVILAIGAFVAYEYSSFSHPAPETESAANAEPAAAVTQQLPSQPQPDANLPNDGFPFHDLSILKPPTGAKVAIYEFEDLECPACAQAYPLVHTAAAQYKVPLVRRDYPWPFHQWSFDAAVTARYLQDKVSPTLADAFRGDVFANQAGIASKEDLDRFTRAWFQSHGQTLPFVIDPTGACRTEVESDRALGDRIGVKSTPCILVVTDSQQVAISDLRDLGEVLEKALAGTSAATVN